MLRGPSTERSFVHLLIRRARLFTVPALAALALLAPSVALAEGLPQVVASPTITGPVIGGGTVSCDGAQFSGDALGAVSFAWFKAGGGQVGSAQAYVPTAADIGWEISCRATVSNADGSAEANSPYVPVEDGTPQSVKAPTVAGSPMTGATVTCSPGTWSGGVDSYAYQWLLNDKPIKGATATKLRLLDSFYEKTVVCRVTATNVSGSAARESRAIVANHPQLKVSIAKVQPKLPTLKQAAARGITSKIACNASCATESHAFILTTDARRLGISGRDLGGLTIVGVGHARRTFTGQLVVTTVLSASAKRGFAKATGPLRVDLLFETAWGPKYSFKLVHEADSYTVKLKR
ncbi:MAG: hypothetical protein JWN72_1325 [Thermoleophilia bacterium]|nr:hypothetical protein [Thermoleophilia bacterium]